MFLNVGQSSFPTMDSFSRRARLCLFNIQYSTFNVQRSIMVYPLQTILITDRVRYKNNKVADGGGRLNLALLLEYNKIQISYSESIKQQDRIEFSSSSYHSRPEE